MKIKSDFVTNSSSTAYVIMVPDSFKVTDENIKKHINEHNIKEEDKESYKKDVQILVERYKIGSAYGGGGGTVENDYEILDNIMIDICEENGFIVASEDSGGETTVIPVDYKSIIKLLLKHEDLEKLLEETLKEEK